MRPADRRELHGTLPDPVVQSVRRILKALVRLLMQFGVSFPQLVEWLKRSYVEVAEHEYTLADKPQTDTRLSLLTGIHRKDIRRLRAGLEPQQSEPRPIRIGGEIIRRWVSDPEYLDVDGLPRELDLRSDAGPSFEALVSAVFKQDLRARVVLDEWRRLGYVSESSKQRLRLNVEALLPGAGFTEHARFLGMNIADHLAAAAGNLQSGQPLFLDHCVCYEGMSDRSIAELRELAQQHGLETLKFLNQRAAQLQALQAEPGGALQRVSIGLYFYHASAQGLDAEAEWDSGPRQGVLSQRDCS